MRGRIHAERHVTDDGESGVGQGGRESFGVGFTLRRCVARTDDGQGWSIEQVGPALDEENGGRIRGIEQPLRIGCVGQGQNAVARLGGPGKGYGDLASGIVRQQTLCLLERDGATQRCCAGSEYMVGKSEIGE